MVMVLKANFQIDWTICQGKEHYSRDTLSLGQQCHVGEKPTVMLYTYINRHAKPPNITKQKTL